MKKLFTLALASYFIFCAWLSFDFAAQKNYLGIIDPGGINCILHNTAKLSPEDFSNLLMEKGVSNHVAIITLDFPETEARSTEEVFDFVIHTNDMTIYENLLIAGTLPKDSNEFLSTEKNNNDLQTGQISLLSPYNKLEIHFLSSDMIFLFGRQYTLLYENETDIQNFIYDLYESGIEVETSTDSLPNILISSDFETRIFVFVIFTVALFIWCLYIVVSSFKAAGIYKLHGYSKTYTIVKVIKEQFCLGFLISVTLAVLFIVGMLFPNGKLSYFFDLLAVWATLTFFSTLLFLASIILFGLVVVTFYSTPKLIKNQKPYKTLNTINILTKIVLSVLILSVINSTIELNKSIKKIVNQDTYWQQLNNFVEFPIYMGRAVEDEYDLGLKCKALFEYENNRGGVLMQPDSALVMPREFVSDTGIFNPQHPYFWRNNGVRINNNYLEQNPIYDFEGRRVDLSSDEYKDGLTILVPEKYKHYEEIIIADFTELYTFFYHIDEDYFLEMTKGIQPMEHEPRVPQLIYVQNNQSYYLMNPYYVLDELYIIDPIGIVVNNVNFGGDAYLSAISMGDFKARSFNGEGDFAEFEDTIRELNLDQNIFAIRNSHRTFDVQINWLRTDYQFNLILLYASLLILLFVTVFTDVTVLRTNQKRIVLEFLHGHSLFRQCLPLFSFALLYSSLMLIVSFIFYNNNFALIGLLILAELFIEFLIVILTVYTKNISNILYEVF